MLITEKPITATLNNEQAKALDFINDKFASIIPTKIKSLLFSCVTKNIIEHANVSIIGISEYKVKI